MKSYGRHISTGGTRRRPAQTRAGAPAPAPTGATRAQKSMNQARSLHIGLNNVDPNAYNGWDGQLSGCINDSNGMKDLADSLGFSSTLLNDAEANSIRVLQEICTAARDLQSGDIFLLTYSGHGGQVEDANAEEEDAMDETWVLWDRQVVDDELYCLWSQFAPGVRIVVFSDSCHSGTVAKMVLARQIQQSRPRARGAPEPKARNLPLEVQEVVQEKHRGIYNTVQYLSGSKENSDIKASVILISGCQDNQLSYDGDHFGKFTGTVLECWANGEFQGDYPSFHQAILDKMPPEQSPNYFTTGVLYPEFEAQRPFTVESPTGSVSPAPTPTPTPAPAPTPTNSRQTLRVGSRGPDVIYLQNLLRQLGYSLIADGVFGSLTAAHVRDFQSSEGLTADGVVGANTWSALEAAAGQPSQPSSPSQPSQPSGSGQPNGARPTLRPGATGDDVLYLQERLLEYGYSLTADGVFGPRTTSAVRSFQSAHGLAADGVVGANTWAALEEEPAFA
jgi:peptidoglycan hydrolase-like protein with peptidoglycan-binding domain